jgi:hypothetical protein
MPESFFTAEYAEFAEIFFILAFSAISAVTISINFNVTE